MTSWLAESGCYIRGRGGVFMPNKQISKEDTP